MAKVYWLCLARNTIINKTILDNVRLNDGVTTNTYLIV